MEFSYGHQWHELFNFNYLGNKVKQIWHVAREVTIRLMTIFIGLKIILGTMRVFLSIGMLRSVTKTVVALEPIKLMGELGIFNISNNVLREQYLTRKGPHLNCVTVTQNL